MLNTRFSVWPSFSDEEVQAVAETVRSNKVNYWTGSECREFEREFAAFAGTQHAIALANGTVALDLALKVLGVEPGDEVIVTPRTFLASASCVVTAGATPVFADVDRDSQNITAETIAAVLTPTTKAIICVHLAGWPCDMDPIMALATKHGIYVIEDCAQAHGARYKGRPVGGIGHMGAWSFCQDKIMTTGGEGGMLTLNDSEWWSRAWSYKDHGKSWSAVYEKAHPPGFRWVHESFGTNWRMIEMQAVIGRIQLRRIPEWTRRRGDNARRILDTCREFSAIRVPEFRCGACSGSCPVGAGCVHAQYKTYVFVRPDRLKGGWTRDRIIDEINRAGVPCYQGSCSEVYLEKAFDDTGWRPKERLPVAKELGETSLMFLVHPTLTDTEIDKTCEAIREVLSQASV
ncbi:MAG: DegT/DnrJ/EryC1/StrS aminotransferase family protein [Gammaproteobacteria bacterium]|nr:DegT/DnrJ/EryC1/StrS aminotransferase family protein [Gammaproteobacteria bacterium]